MIVRTPLRLRRIETVPIWDDDGCLRPPHEGEERDDLPVVGWANILVVDGLGRGSTRLLAVFREEE